jgi:hypothetical protein
MKITMKTLLLSLLILCSITQHAVAKPLDLSACLTDHKSILYRHAYQIHTEVNRLMYGITMEKANGAPEAKIKKLKSLLGKLIIKEYVIHDVIRQTNKALHQDQLVSDPRAAYLARDLINTDEIALDTNISAKKHNPAAFLLHKYKDEVIFETFTDLGEEIYHSVGNGTVLKIIGGTYSAQSFRTALISFGSNVLKGAGISAALSLIATPLTGARLSPADLWLHMLEKRPELIVNPEWMNEAGSPDAPWFAHCSAISTKEKKITEIVKQLNVNEEQSFIHKIAQIEARYSPNVTSSPLPAVADHTFVSVPKTVEQQVPAWALIR